MAPENTKIAKTAKDPVLKKTVPAKKKSSTVVSPVELVAGAAVKPAKANVSLPKKAAKKGAKKTGQPVSVVSSVSKTDKAPKNAAIKTISKTSSGKKGMRIIFQLNFHTVYGQELFITGDHPLLGNNDPENAVAMQFFNEDYWYAVLDIEPGSIPANGIVYNYILKNEDGSLSYDWGHDKKIAPVPADRDEVLQMDTWNYGGYFENTFYTEPFEQVLLDHSAGAIKPSQPKRVSHVLKIKSPLLTAGQTLCVLGSCDTLGNWQTDAPVLLGKAAGEDVYTVSLDLSKESFPIAYKYGIYDTNQNRFLQYENGNNRVLHDAGSQNRLTIMNDGFAVLPNDTWKGAGVAIPVFSLRSEKSFGVGEFSDLKLLADWAAQAGLKMIQILPINDTTATHTWTDSYPYAAISAFALHPLYLNLESIADSAGKKTLSKLEAERKRLNALDAVDYVTVTKTKMEFARTAFAATGKAILATEDYHAFFEQNKHWLVSYAAFCYLRDQYGTVNFSKWPAYRSYQSEEIAKLTSTTSAASNDIALYYFIQYHLHLQLKDATAYAHAKGIIVKGDIAIGVYRHGVDAWQSPELYHMDYQAGAPPDDFAVTGQNWGFPTYNWQRMREDGFAWWKQRFAQMSYYFDAFRIDHILGFFRIWSIPMDAVEGIMGHFVPAIPVHITEFNSRGIWFDHARYTKPFITDGVLWEVFGTDNELVKSMFLVNDGYGAYALKPAFRTQRQVEQHFETLEQDEQHNRIKLGLYTLISNVILFEAEAGDGQQFHFRFGIESTSSFRYLEWNTQQQLKALYINYFFERQDDFWMQEALQKLPALKRVTDMLVCGEDLGLVPSCVPDVMKQLGLLSLEIQRMPKDPKKEFFHPNDAPYLSVVTPSTHDMSTIRGWWEEDPERIQHFYNHDLGQSGEAPRFCEAWINKAIVLQHLYSPAMWSVFQLQDLFGISETMRRENPADERINIPADPKHYWRYRMHMTIEEMMQQQEFTNELKNYIQNSGR